MKIFKKIIKKIKNQIFNIFGNVVIATTPEKQIFNEPIKPEENDLEISEEDAIKFQTTAMEYTPENKKYLQEYYAAYRKYSNTETRTDPYILGVVDGKFGKIYLKDRAKENGLYNGKSGVVKRILN